MDIFDKDRIEYQDKLAAKSSVFAKILQSERTDDVDNTNRPESLTRNAMITFDCIYSEIHKNEEDAIKAWEDDLLSSDFYDKALK